MTTKSYYASSVADFVESSMDDVLGGNPPIFNGVQP
jgi:hypothetical protein